MVRPADESAVVKESAGHDTGGHIVDLVDPRTHQAHHHHSASASYAVLWEGVKHASGEQVSVHTVVEDWSAMVVVFGTGALPVGELRAFAGVWNFPLVHLGEATMILVALEQVSKGVQCC